MASRENADALLDAGKRKAGLKELYALAEEYRRYPAFHSETDTAELLIHIAYEIRLDRKNGMPHFGKEAVEAASLMKDARTHLDASGERADHPVWYRWYSVSRRFFLMDAEPFKAADILEEQIEALVGLGSVDPKIIENLRELKRKDMNPPVTNAW
jgi:hypothetical protein